MKKLLSQLLALGCCCAARLSRHARIASAAAMVVSGLVQAAASAAQMSDGSPVDPSERVYQYDLSGPRLGGTFLPDGSLMSQFGWHFENQASGNPHGPWFIVEKVFLVGGLEQSAFVPNATMVFGMRLPNSFEFGLGPSATIDDNGLHSGIVVAAGHSFRAGGIRLPVNVACAFQRGGDLRWTIITGWAIRDQVER